LEVAWAATDLKIKKMIIDEAHAKLGHRDENFTRKAAAELGIEITRGSMRCVKHARWGKSIRRIFQRRVAIMSLWQARMK
jgi:ABC-type uncharacterized transport system auxiliary subunit